MYQTDFTIIGTSWWCPESCKRAGVSVGAVSAQVTKCESDLGDIFYVRENTDGSTSFYASSGERWGWKTHGRISKRYQVLELCTDGDKEYVWSIAQNVAQYDHLQRRLNWNPQFTTEWAEKFTY